MHMPCVSSCPLQRHWWVWCNRNNTLLCALAWGKPARVQMWGQKAEQYGPGWLCWMRFLHHQTVLMCEFELIQKFQSVEFRHVRMKTDVGVVRVLVLKIVILLICHSLISRSFGLALSDVRLGFWLLILVRRIRFQRFLCCADQAQNFLFVSLSSSSFSGALFVLFKSGNFYLRLSCLLTEHVPASSLGWPRQVHP